MAHEREIILQAGPWKTNPASPDLGIFHGTSMEMWGVPRRGQFQARAPSTALLFTGRYLISMDRICYYLTCLALDALASTDFTNERSTFRK